MTDLSKEKLDDLVHKVREDFARLSPDEQQAMLREQRESWIKGETAMDEPLALKALDAGSATGEMVPLKNGGEGQPRWVVLTVFDWSYMDKGEQYYARTPERAKALQVQGVKLTPVYTVEEPKGEPHRLTENELYYLRSIYRMLKDSQARVKHGPTLHTEALGDNLDWLEMFIESAGRVYDEADLARATRKAEEEGYDKAVRDYASPPADSGGMREALDKILNRDLNVNNEELLRIRNDLVATDRLDGQVKIWGKMLMKLTDAIRDARAALKEKTE